MGVETSYFSSFIEDSALDSDGAISMHFCDSKHY